MSLNITPPDLHDVRSFMEYRMGQRRQVPADVWIGEQQYIDHRGDFWPYYTVVFVWPHLSEDDPYTAVPRPLDQYEPRDVSRGLEAPVWSGDELSFFDAGFFARHRPRPHLRSNPTILPGLIVGVDEFLDWFQNDGRARSSAVTPHGGRRHPACCYFVGRIEWDVARAHLLLFDQNNEYLSKWSIVAPGWGQISDYVARNGTAFMYLG